MNKLALCLLRAAVFAGFFAAQVWAEEVTLQVLGSGGPELQDGRRSSSYLLWQGGNARVLVDAGPGSSVAFGQSGAKFEDLQGLLFTHLHVDHAADLPAFVKGSFFTPRKRDLLIIGPAGNALMPSTTDFLARLFGERGAFAYLSNYLSPGKEDYLLRGRDVALDAEQPLSFALDKSINALAVPVHHGPVAAVAWRVEIDGVSVVFSGDTSNQTGALTALALGSDVLVAHAAIPEGLGGVARRLHMPPSEIGKVAAQAKVKTLVLSHFMRRSQNREERIRKVIQEHFSGPIHFAYDGFKVAL